MCEEEGMGGMKCVNTYVYVRKGVFTCVSECVERGWARGILCVSM